MRLDKMLSNMGYGSRKDVKKLVKSGAVKINETVAVSADAKIDTATDKIYINNDYIPYKEHIYLMMNKPAGVISATEDNFQKTVIDILPERYKSFNLFPVGRLDIDTEGLLLLTDDGKLAHSLLSPKSHVAKTYYAHIDGIVTNEDVKAFTEGILLDDGYKTLPAKLTVLKSDEISFVEIVIFEGKFHQVKRMFLALDKKVIYLKRIKMGNLFLDEELSSGEVKEVEKSDI